MSHSRHFFHQAIFLSARGSLPTALGYLATWVSMEPKVVLTFTIELMAQPLALSTGPRLRLRSLSQARSMEGPLMTTTTKAMAISGLYHAWTRNLATAASATPSAPTARPMAAKMPANLAMSKAGLGAEAPSRAFSSAALVARSVVVLSALAVMLSNCLLSFSSALLLILSVTQLPNLR